MVLPGLVQIINSVYFPSFSAGWNISKENFWSTNNVVKSLKLSGGYGVVGNDASGDFQYLSRVVGGYNYSIGNSGVVTTGYAPETLDNPDLALGRNQLLQILVLMHNYLKPLA